MAVINNFLSIEIQPTVPEVCAVINAVAAFYPGQEAEVLEGIQKSIAKRIEELKNISKESATKKEADKNINFNIASTEIEIENIAKEMGEVIKNQNR